LSSLLKRITALPACSPACCLLRRPQDHCLPCCCFQALRAHRPQRMAARAWCAQVRVRGQGQGLVQGQGRAAQPSSSSQTGRRRWMVTRGCARPPPCALICSSRLIRRSSVTCRPRPPRLSAPPPALQGNPGGGVQGRATLRRCTWADEAACAFVRPQHPRSRMRDRTRSSSLVKLVKRDRARGAAPARRSARAARPAAPGPPRRAPCRA